MSELADETDSKSVVLTGVWVQVPLPAPVKRAIAFAIALFKYLQILHYLWINRCVMVGIRRFVA